jgi:hypothetical protein
MHWNETKGTLGSGRYALSPSATRTMTQTPPTSDGQFPPPDLSDELLQELDLLFQGLAVPSEPANYSGQDTVVMPDSMTQFLDETSRFRRTDTQQKPKNSPQNTGQGVKSRPTPEASGKPGTDVEVAIREPPSKVRGAVGHPPAPTPVADQSEHDRTDGVAYLIESISRAIVRTAPHGIAGNTERVTRRKETAERLHEMALKCDRRALAEAVLALKEMVYDLLHLRSSITALSAASSRASIALNQTEHRLHQLEAFHEQLLGAIATLVPEAGPLTDKHAQGESRLAAALNVLEALSKSHKQGEDGLTEQTVGGG